MSPEKKLKILFVHYLESLGGGERYLVNLMNALSEEELLLLTPSPKADFEPLLTSVYRKLSLPFGRNLGPFPGFSLPLARFLKKVVRDEGIDVIHLNDHYLIPTLLAVKWATNVKIVFTSHGAWDVHFAINRILLKLLDPITFAATPVHYFRLRPLVHNLHFLPFFTAEPKPFRKNPSDKFRIGLVGRFSPVKNHELAFQIIDLLGDAFELHLFGGKTLKLKEESDVYEQKILQMARRRENVISHGIQSDPETIYSTFDLLLITSRNESFGMTAIEAFSHALPVVSTFTEGTSFTVIDGYNGFLCTSPDSFAEAISAIRNRYRQFSDNAGKSASRFAPAPYIAKLRNLYRS